MKNILYTFGLLMILQISKFFKLCFSIIHKSFNQAMKAIFAIIKYLFLSIIEITKVLLLIIIIIMAVLIIQTQDIQLTLEIIRNIIVKGPQIILDFPMISYISIWIGIIGLFFIGLFFSIMPKRFTQEIKAISTIIKVILLIYVILPILVTLMFISIKASNSISKLIETGQNTPESIQAMWDNIFIEITSTSSIMFITILSGIIGLLCIGLFFRIRHKKFTKELKICMIDKDKFFPLYKTIIMLISVGIAINFCTTLILNIPYPQEWIIDYPKKINSISMDNIWFIY